MRIPPTYINDKDERTLTALVHENLFGDILDVGCGRGTIKNFLPKGTTYTGIDGAENSGADIVGDVHALPFKNESYDGVICTAVLEHVRDVDKVISEMHRVLKKDGVAIITIPFIHHYHKDPEDYRRLSHVGLKDILEKHGFSTVHTHMNYGVYAVVEYAFFCVLVHARRENLFIKKWYMLPYYVIIFMFFIFFKLINYSVGFLQKHDTSMYVGVVAVARKV
jgi:SAM-dependent methyltransferase